MREWHASFSKGAPWTNEQPSISSGLCNPPVFSVLRASPCPCEIAGDETIVFLETRAEPCELHLLVPSSGSASIPLPVCCLSSQSISSRLDVWIPWTGVRPERPSGRTHKAHLV